MLFNSPLYGIFLFVTYVAFWALRRRSFLRPLFLTLASYLFYVVGTYDAATEQEVPLGPIGWATAIGASAGPHVIARICTEGVATSIHSGSATAATTPARIGRSASGRRSCPA